ncbi:hypothetical protein MMC14_004513 [Varicellaria rhodocarpa]|nr:hypothetical protein [Varicellaria rhodocarpa]
MHQQTNPRTPTTTDPTAVFSNPFSPRPNRSLSTSSTSSFRTCLSSSNSNSSASSSSNPSTPLSISSVLFHSPLDPQPRHHSASPFSAFRFSSFSYKSFTSSSSSRALSSRRPSYFSLADVEEEKAEFGEECVGLLEPRPRVGWWGVREVLEEEC